MFCTSVTLSVFLPEQPHQTEQDGSRHHQQTDNHCRRNREVNAGLNDGRVGDACELLRRDIGFVDGERDCFVGSGIHLIAECVAFGCGDLDQLVLTPKLSHARRAAVSRLQKQQHRG